MMADNGDDVLADLRLRYPETTPHQELDGMVPDYRRAEADRRLRYREGNAGGHCRDCGLPVWWSNDRLVTRDGNRWCYGPGRSRIAMERWHALPDMAQYVVPGAESQVCHCLARAKPHIHKIIEVDT